MFDFDPLFVDEAVGVSELFLEREGLCRGKEKRQRGFSVEEGAWLVV